MHATSKGSENLPAWTPGAYSALFSDFEENVEAESFAAAEAEAEPNPEPEPVPEIAPADEPVLEVAQAMVAAAEPQPAPELEPVALPLPAASMAATLSTVPTSSTVSTVSTVDTVDTVDKVDMVDMVETRPAPQVAPTPPPAAALEPVAPPPAAAPAPEPVAPPPAAKPQWVAPPPVVNEAAIPAFVPPDAKPEVINVPPPLLRPPPPKLAPTAEKVLPPPVRPVRAPVQPAPQPAPESLPPVMRPARAPVQPPPQAMRPLPSTSTTAEAPPAAVPRPVAQPGAVAIGSRLEVVNREGWSKEYLLQRTLIYAGSQPGSDIYLPAPEVAPRHIQFVPSPVNRAGYRLINLSAAPLTVRESGGVERAVPPRAAAELSDGDAVSLAGYSMVFHSGEMQSAAIQARVELPSTRLEIDKPIEGSLYIRNAGDKAGVQFEVQVQGFDPRFVQVDSGPVLFPGVEKRIAFRIAHPHQAKPPAGDHTLTLVVTAPSVYPGESAVVSATFAIAPFFAHTVRFISVAPSMEGYTLS